MRTLSQIEKLLAAAQKELASLDSERSEILEKIESLQKEKELLEQTISESLHPYSGARVSNQSTEHEKITLFRGLFRGREDVYPRRFETT